MKKSLYERVKLEEEESKSILDWTGEVFLEETNEVLNGGIVEDNRASNTTDDIDFFKGVENNLGYDKKEDMNFMFVVAQDEQINIREYFKFNDCDKCENLRTKYTSLDGSVLVEDILNSEEKDGNDTFGRHDEPKVSSESEFLGSLECEVEDLMKKNFEIVSRLWIDKTW